MSAAGAPGDTPEARLARLVESEVDRAAPPDVKALAAELRRRHGDAVAGVLFYGSILRARGASEGVHDFYVLVDGYARAYRAARAGSVARAARCGRRCSRPRTGPCLRTSSTSSSRTRDGRCARSTAW